MNPQRPNIILITTDQQRGDCLSMAGHPVVQTPNLDAMAAEGAFFRRGTSDCPSCFPARRSLMSGMSAAAQGMVGMGAGSDWDPPHTLAGLLRNAGYQTQLVGKLHIQPRGKRFGFEHQELADAPFDESNAYTRWLRERHGRIGPDTGNTHGVDPNGWVGRPGILPEEQTMTWWCIDRAIDFLHHRRDPTAPFFLNVSLFDPHPPLVPPPCYYDRYIRQSLPPPVIGNWAHDPGQQPGQRVNAWRVNLNPALQHQLQAAYYGTINFIDDQIARLLLYLQRARLLHDTLIVFTSDHGEMLGDHHLFRKCWPYEGSTRIPYIIKPPPSWNLAPGVVSDCPVGLQDILPTLLDAAGAEIPKACTGRSLLPIVRGESQAVRDVFHAEDCGTYDRHDGYHMLLTDRYKYVWFAQRPVEHLFDLQHDPQELHDLAHGGTDEELLAPWRQCLIRILADRPEGFAREGRLLRGQPYEVMIPGYQPDRFYPYL